MDKEDYEFDARRDVALQARAQEQAAQFGPHCPECFTPTQRNRIRYSCHVCGLRFEQASALMLRALAPQPAPPYTDAEIGEIDRQESYIIVPGSDGVERMRRL